MRRFVRGNILTSHLESSISKAIVFSSRVVCFLLLIYHVFQEIAQQQLITALRTAVENGEGMFDKETPSHDDLFDAFRLSLHFWHW
jgi:hypothetical protein